MKCPDVARIAKHFDASLWTVKSDILSLILGLDAVLLAVCEPNRLLAAIRNERMFGRNGSSAVNLKQFSGYFFSCEETSGNYKPVAAKEYNQQEYLAKPNYPKWPALRLTRHSRNSVFAPYSEGASLESSEHSSDVENQELALGHNESANPSGFFSGSVAQNTMRTIHNNPILAKMAQRVNLGKKRVREEVDEDQIEADAQAKRRKNYHVYPMVFQKSGFCENCNLKYDDYRSVNELLDM
jgi:hypothetical protein